MSELQVPLLESVGVTKAFPAGGQFDRRLNVAVRDVSVAIHAGQSVAIIGESGCGKTTLTRMLLRLLRPTEGEVRFSGIALTQPSGPELLEFRRQVQAVFQNPFASLSPRMRIRDIVAEPLRSLSSLDKRAVEARTAELLDHVGMSYETHAHRYPHQLSGGQRQRVAIARALSTRPSLLVLDEPTSALDASIRAQVLNLLADLQVEERLTFLLVSHNFGDVAHLSRYVSVMYRGRIVEQDLTKRVLDEPRHPYSQVLTAAGAWRVGSVDDAVAPNEGDISTALDTTTGCAFEPRCPFRMPVCKVVEPDLKPVGGLGGRVACHLFAAEQESVPGMA